MCISNNKYPEQRVDLGGSILLGGVALNEQRQERHVLAYSVEVTTLAKGSSRGSADLAWSTDDPVGDEFGPDLSPAPRRVGNAVLFMVPAKRGSLTPDCLIPVSKYPRFLKDIQTAVAPPAPTRRSASRGAMSFGDVKGLDAVVVKGFDDGVYDVVIAPEGASQIASVIAQVDEDKRPQLNEELYAELDIVCPGWTAVLFCFSESTAKQAGAQMISYEPLMPHLIFLPGLDGHNGAIERGNVTLDHTIAFFHYRMAKSAATPVRYSDDALQLGPQFPGQYPPRRRGPGFSTAPALGMTAPPKKLPWFIPSAVIGTVIPAGTKAPQGDFYAKVADVEQGVLRVSRDVPKTWRNLPGNPAKPNGGRMWTIRRDGFGYEDEAR